MQDSYSYVRSTAPAVAYDSKQYYQQPVATPAVAAAAAQPQQTVAESYYQTGTLETTWHLNGKKYFHSSVFIFVNSLLSVYFQMWKAYVFHKSFNIEFIL